MKRIFTLTAMAVAITAACAAQTPTNVGAPSSSTTGEYEDVTYIPDKETSTETIVGKDAKYYNITMVDTPPKYAGGEAAMMQWLGENIHYPAIAQANNVEGRVIVKFVVFADGSVGQVEILRSPDAELSREAKRVVSIMPKWTPGTMGGKPVNVHYILPITFKLNN